MIETLVEGGSRDLFPACSRVTRLAALLEATVMNISMAVGALAKGNPWVSRFPFRVRRVAFLTSDLGVQSGQWIARLGMVELLDRAGGFPIGEVVALLTIRAQPALMRIFVTCGTCLRNAEESLVQILDLDERTIGGGNVFGGMTAITGQSRVFRLQRVAGLLVIKRAGIPLDDWKIFSIVVRVAANTTLAGASLQIVGGMEAPVRRDARRNLGMAFHTFESWLPRGKLVTRCAVARAIQRLVSARQRPG